MDTLTLVDNIAINEEHTPDTNHIQDDGSAANTTVPADVSIDLSSGVFLRCEVCYANIDIRGLQHRHVVTCHNCGEAMPTKPAPSGVRYMRCTCKCLVICQSSDISAVCPRQSCKAVINLGNIAIPTGFMVFTCAYCAKVFTIRKSWKPLVKCSHCRRNSTPGTDLKKKGRIMLAVGIALFLAFILGAVYVNKLGGFDDPAFIIVFIVAVVCGTAGVHVLPIGIAFMIVRKSHVASVNINIYEDA